MWAETVDSSDLHNTVWPRAAAVAEVLWTPLEVVYPNGIEAGESSAACNNTLFGHRIFESFSQLQSIKIDSDVLT